MGRLTVLHASLDSSLMKVLLIEDHPGMAKVSCDLLRERYGHDVQHAATGREALAAIPEFDPDLILLDLNLPDGHGYPLAEQIRQLPSGQRAILVALTAFALTGDTEKSRAAGIDAHYRKPMDFAELTQLKRFTPAASSEEAAS